MRRAERPGGAGDQAADQGEQEARGEHLERDRRVQLDRVGRRARQSAPKPKAPGVVECARRASRRRRRRRESPRIPSATPSSPPPMPWASDSPATWRTTSHCVQPSAFSVPSSRTRLPDRGERQQHGEQERRRGGEDLEGDAEPVGKVRRVHERAADLVGDVLRARDLRVRVELLDLLLDVADRGAARGADEHDVRHPLLARERLQLGKRDVDVGRLPAERRLDDADDRELRLVQIERGADLQPLAARVGVGEECLVRRVRGDEAAARDQ